MKATHQKRIAAICACIALLSDPGKHGKYMVLNYIKGRKKLQQIIPATENLVVAHISFLFSSFYKSIQNGNPFIRQLGCQKSTLVF